MQKFMIFYIKLEVSNSKFNAALRRNFKLLNLPVEKVH